MRRNLIGGGVSRVGVSGVAQVAGGEAIGVDGNLLATAAIGAEVVHGNGVRPGRIDGSIVVVHALRNQDQWVI